MTTTAPVGLVVAQFTVGGEPVSKARARVGKHGTYTPEKTAAAEEKIGWEFRRAVGPHEPDAEHLYAVTAAFYSATRRRRDVDNMLKLVLDAMNKVAWKDDAQVVEIAARKAICVAGDARTEITLYQLDPS